MGIHVWTLPTPLLLFAGAVALVPLAFLLRRPVSLPRLVVEAFGISLAIIAAVWAGCGEGVMSPYRPPRTRGSPQCRHRSKLHETPTMATAQASTVRPWTPSGPRPGILPRAGAVFGRSSAAWEWGRN